MYIYIFCFFYKINNFDNKIDNLDNLSLGIVLKTNLKKFRLDLVSNFETRQGNIKSWNVVQLYSWEI